MHQTSLKATHQPNELLIEGIEIFSEVLFE